MQEDLYIFNFPIYFYQMKKLIKLLKQKLHEQQ